MRLADVGDDDAEVPTAWSDAADVRAAQGGMGWWSIAESNR